VEKECAINRRDFLKAASASAAIGLLPGWVLAGDEPAIKKPSSVSGELLPVIGMGSARTFDVGNDPTRRTSLQNVLQTFFDNGGGLIDSSPMYGNAETAIGDLLQNISNKQTLFAATKVWTDGKQEGIAQMQRYIRRMGVNNPAVTCAIPATSKVHHMADNMSAGFGRLPTSVERQQMLRFFGSL